MISVCACSRYSDTLIFLLVFSFLGLSSIHESGEIASLFFPAFHALSPFPTLSLDGGIYINAGY